MDKEYADCSIPQEKSNSEINAELGISDGDEDAFDIPSNSKGLESRQIGECILITRVQLLKAPVLHLCLLVF